MLRFSRLVLFVLAATCGAFANAEPPEEASTAPRVARRLFAFPSGTLILRLPTVVEQAPDFSLDFVGWPARRWQRDIWLGVQIRWLL